MWDMVIFNQRQETDQACLADLVVSFTQLFLHFRVIMSCVAKPLVHFLYLIQQRLLCLRKTRYTQPKGLNIEGKENGSTTTVNFEIFLLYF